MNARPEIRQRLIEIKIARWCRVAKYPSLDPRCPPSRARRNFWRLISKYPETAEKLRLTAVSVYGF
ncbi:MAG: hypothetical protein QOG55_1069 [Acidobacteriaceae bacterium]|jgi:hypothetical protein|nr:hypothetical protein [Acidobacteriaceae bacterium]